MIGILKKDKMIIIGATIRDLLDLPIDSYDEIIIKNNLIYIYKEGKNNGKNEL